MEVDVAIVGGGPAGLATAIKLAQLAAEAGTEISICLLEKGSEVGAHILSGAVFESRALEELFADWAERDAPLGVPVNGDRVHYLLSANRGVRVPGPFVPGTMKNHGNHIISLGNLCRWLAARATELGVEIFPGFAATEVLYREDGTVRGVATGDMGISAGGEHRPGFEPGIELLAKYTVFAEGCRGHLGKQLIARFDLDEGRDPQHYGIGFKELWNLDPARHQPGLVIHTTGWPAQPGTVSGSFFYHAENHQAALGYVVPLSYDNPHLSPFDEFQQWKQHPRIRHFLVGGERVGYGARALIKGGPQSRPRMCFPGGLLIGDNAGTLNFAKIKGSHTAMKSGILAAETLFAALNKDSEERDLSDYENRLRTSWLHTELHRTRNFGPAMHRFGAFVGSAFAFVDQNIFRGRLPFTLRDPVPDHQGMQTTAQAQSIRYPKPDGVISFDKLSSVFLSNTNHEEDQPCHLQLADPTIPIARNLPDYDEPAQRYCPAGVYEVVEDAGGQPRFQINAQNCVHCKTCDIKDPAQNITWIAPEGSGGPNYSNM